MFCAKCCVEKNRFEFYESNRTKCKSCVREAARKWRLDHLEYAKEQDRSRGKDPRRVAENKKRAPKYKAKRKVYSERYWEKFPEKRRAQIAVGNAVRDGKLKKMPCEACGKPKAHAHHEDYSQPLVVTWLCVKCHNEFHESERERGRKSTKV